MAVKLLWWSVRATGWNSSLWNLLETCLHGAWKSLPLGSAAPQNLLWTKLKGCPGKQLAAKCCWLLWTAESGATDSTRWWEHIRARKRKTLRPLEGRSGSVSVRSLSPSVHKVLFEPSEPFWQVWSLILNAILPLLPSWWGFSSARGCGFFFVFFLVRSNILLLMVVQQRVVILEFLQKMSISPSTPPSWDRSYFSDKGPSSQSCIFFFFSSHVWM